MQAIPFSSYVYQDKGNKGGQIRPLFLYSEPYNLTVILTSILTAIPITNDIIKQHTHMESMDRKAVFYRVSKHMNTVHGI